MRAIGHSQALGRDMRVSQVSERHYQRVRMQLGNNLVGLLHLVMKIQRVCMRGWWDLKIFWAGYLKVAKNATLREETFYLTKLSLWPVEIIWWTKTSLNNMNKGYTLYCWCVVIILTCADDSWDKLLGLLKMKVVIIIVKICVMIVSGLREFNCEIIASIIHGN